MYDRFGKGICFVLVMNWVFEFGITCFRLESHYWINSHGIYMSVKHTHLQAHWQRWRCRAPWCCSHCKGWSQPVEKSFESLLDHKERKKPGIIWYQPTKNPSPRMQERATEFQAAAVNFSTKHLFLGERYLQLMLTIKRSSQLVWFLSMLHSILFLQKSISPECGRPISCGHCSDEHRKVG